MTKLITALFSIALILGAPTTTAFAKKQKKHQAATIPAGWIGASGQQSLEPRPITLPALPKTRITIANFSSLVKRGPGFDMS